MPLDVVKRKDKEYYYFLMGASKRVYLGTPRNPKKERVKEAALYLRNRIKDYENDLLKLESLLHGFPKAEGKGPPQYKLVFFDLDGVIFDKPWHETSSDKVAVSTWDVVFQELGIYTVHEKLKQRFVSGEYNSYMDWTEDACNVLKSIGLDRTTFQNIIGRRPLSQGAVELFQKLRESKIATAIATGSFEALARRASRELGGVNEVLAHCKLNFDRKGLLESWELRTTDYKDKVFFVRETAKKHHIPLDRCVYVGDDVNDIDAFEEVGLAVAFNSKKFVVQQAADVVIDGRDLTAVLPHLYVPLAGVGSRRRGKKGQRKTPT